MTISPAVSKPSATTTLSASFSTTSWPGLSSLELDGGAHMDPHLPAAGEHVGGAVVAGGQEDAEARRRLRQPVDLFLERDDLVPGLAQRAGQPLVLRGDGGQAGLGLAQPLLEKPRLAGRIREPAAQSGDLLVKEGDLRGKAFDLIVMP